MTGGQPQCRGGEAGFTLMELLVSITLLGLLGILMVGGFSFGVRVWERTESAAQDQSRVAAVQALLRRQVAQMQPLQVRGTDRRQRLAIDAKPDRLTFVGAVPEYLGRGGYHLISLETEIADGGSSLVMRWEPFTRSRPGLALSDEAHKEVLLAGIEELRFKYLGKDQRGASTGWIAAWPDVARLPELVEIRAVFDESREERWPILSAAVVTGAGRR